MTAADAPPAESGARRVALFPLPGALLFPGLHLPLHVFEPRYRALVADALVRDRLIGMIQPRGTGERPPLYAVGCLGKIVDVEALEDERYNILLEGVAKFRVVEELDRPTAFRQVSAELVDDREEDGALASVERAALEAASKAFADALGYSVDWEGVERLDDRSLVNGIAQIAPFDVAAKQALLEADGLAERSELLIQLMQFFGRGAGEDDGRVTLQ